MKPYDLSASRPKLGLLTNPHSRRNRTRLPAVNAIVANQPNIHHRITEQPQQITDALREFAETLEKVVVDTVESGDMTKDLALLVGPEQESIRRLDSELHDREVQAERVADIVSKHRA